MDYAMLLRILTEAEARVATHSDAGVRERSQETVAICQEKMRREGLSRDDLERLALAQMKEGAQHA